MRRQAARRLRGLATDGLHLFTRSGNAIFILGAFAVGLDLLESSLFPTLTLLLDKTVSFPFLPSINDIAHGGSGAKEVGVICVDIGTLDGDERFDIVGCRA